MPTGCTGTPLITTNNTSFLHMGLTNGTTYYYRLCAYDNALNVTSVTASAKPLPETIPPTLNEFYINDGLGYGKSTSTTLHISASDDSGVDKMCISNTTNCSSWVNYATTYPWTVTSGDGLKRVYIWFRDIYGNTNDTPFSAQIVIDNGKPVDNISPLILTPGTNEDELSITIKWLSATDALSPIIQYRVMGSATGTPTSCTATPLGIVDAQGSNEYKHTNLPAGKKYYYRVCAVDAAGNISAGKTGSAVPIDTVAPANPKILINDDAPFTKKTSVTLTLSAEDAGGIAKICISITPTCTSWVTFTPTKKISLPFGSGLKTVYAMFKDGAGNISSQTYDTILLDTVKPVDGKLTGMSMNGKVLLSWTNAVESGGSGMDKYIVKLGATSYPSCTTGTTLYEGMDTSFIHEGLTNGTSYYYRVCALDKAGNYSSGKTYLGKPSNVITFTGAFPIATSLQKEQAFRVAFNGTRYMVGMRGVRSNPNGVGVQFLTKEGVKIGSVITIPGALTGIEPQVASDGNRFIITWNDYSSKIIKGQIINADGTLYGTAFTISQTAMDPGCINTYANPIFDGTNYFVIWNYDAACTEDGSGHDVFGRFISSTGEMVGPIINITGNAPLNTRQEYHAISFDGEKFLVVWQDARRGVVIEDPCNMGNTFNQVLTDIYGQFISKSDSNGGAGTLVGDNFAIYESDNVIDFEMFSIAYGSNSYMTVWQEMTLVCSNGMPIPSSSNIKGMIIDQDGTPGTFFDITNSSDAKNFAPYVSYDGNSYLVTWNDLSNLTDWEIYAQRFYQDGTVNGEPFKIVSKTDNQVGGVVSYDNSKFFIIWNDKVKTTNPTMEDFFMVMSFLVMSTGCY